MMAIALSDQQISHILLACRPLQPQERLSFLAGLFELLLNRRGEIGEGELGRTLRDLQHQHFTPPSDEEASIAGEYKLRWT
jgi:hypothetical protein